MKFSTTLEFRSFDRPIPMIKGGGAGFSGMIFRRGPAKHARRCETSRADAVKFADIMVHHVVPHYGHLIESFTKAQSVQRDGRETKLDLMDAGKAREEGIPQRGMQPAG